MEGTVTIPLSKYEELKKYEDFINSDKVYRIEYTCDGREFIT